MQIFIEKTAKKYLAKLSVPDRERISAAIQGLAQIPPKGDVKPYVGVEGRWRLKVGQYRILYKIAGETIAITHIRPRGQAYTKETREG